MEKIRYKSFFIEENSEIVITCNPYDVAIEVFSDGENQPEIELHLSKNDFNKIIKIAKELKCI